LVRFILTLVEFKAHAVIAKREGAYDDVVLEVAVGGAELLSTALLDRRRATHEA
jgi:hypothetical protein